MARASSFLDGLKSVPGCEAAFVARVEGVPLSVNKEETLEHLEPFHREVVSKLGFEWEELWRAEQVHGAGLEVVPVTGFQLERLVPEVDGLLTAKAGVLLGIYVADCAAVYLADRGTGAIGLVHSGRKGTEQGIVGEAVERMQREFGTVVGDLEVAISPCIRPPHYEVDIASELRRQLGALGVPEEQVTDSGICTGAEVGEYFSYRIEKGNTGRMLALLGRRDGRESPA